MIKTLKFKTFLELSTTLYAISQLVITTGLSSAL